MRFGRIAAVSVIALTSVALTGCVFSLGGGDDEKPKVRATDACPQRDQASWAKMTAYLESNKQLETVKVTESGLQYRVISSGKGTRIPTWASTVQVRYQGKLIDGSVFDETKPSEPPAEFEAGGVIRGWQEALTMMKEGDKWNIVIPSELAYGCKGKGPIKGDQVLTFDIELLKIK
ncbi:MAG: FKBP-type peptidyl-prolyl cis-trans isomerase [Alphaproteobacteria bacterium]|nr:FKBP-type peptidyl-prolyl cis-trans isomerase [Alphaproteobacteria bacterium]